VEVIPERHDLAGSSGGQEGELEQSASVFVLQTVSRFIQMSCAMHDEERAARPVGSVGPSGGQLLARGTGRVVADRSCAPVTACACYCSRFLEKVVLDARRQYPMAPPLLLIPGSDRDARLRALASHGLPRLAVATIDVLTQSRWEGPWIDIRGVSG
jgi:hypothetical protein